MYEVSIFRHYPQVVPGCDRSSLRLCGPLLYSQLRTEVFLRNFSLFSCTHPKLGRLPGECDEGQWKGFGRDMKAFMARGSSGF